MMNKLADQARSLHQQIHDVLLKDWDPIGVQTMSGAQDEYDAYVPTIYSLLIARKPNHELIEYLLWLETQHMGLTADRQRTEHIAEKLANLV